MLVVDFPTDLSKIVPSVPEGVRSAFQVFVKIALVNFRVSLEIRSRIGDMFVAQVFLFDIIENI